MNSQVWWYLARSSGMVAWIMLTASVAWGLMLSTRVMGSLRRPPWLLAMHRWLGAMSVLMTAGHLAALIADSTVQFGLGEILIPMQSEWRPQAVAWGVAAMYALVAVEVTSLLMRRLSKRLWRAIHLSSFGAFFAASMHAAAAGSDAASGWYRLTAVALVSVVLLLTSYRVLGGTVRGRRRPAGSPRKETRRPLTER